MTIVEEYRFRESAFFFLSNFFKTLPARSNLATVNTLIISKNPIVVEELFLTRQTVVQDYQGIEIFT